MRRRAVVTGGAGGIGGAIVRALAEADHDVAILDREGECAVDLADEQAVRAIAERLGQRDVLVHAAPRSIALVSRPSTRPPGVTCRR